MTENERTGKRPRSSRSADEEIFQQRKSFKFYHREGDEEAGERRNYGDQPRGERQFDDRGGDRKFGDRQRRRYDDDRPRERRFDDDRPRRRYDDDRPRERRFNDDKPRRRYDDDRPRERKYDDRSRSRFEDDDRPRQGRKGYVKEKDPMYDRPKATGEIRLNKYLADCGICSRREADDLIKAGCVTVNDEVITTMGYKVKTEDKVVYGGQTLNREKLRYILLNKPKGYITTSDDPYERDTVMELVKNACHERIFPVGRLDKSTTGLLLFTNDGELAKKLTHPSSEIPKLYQVNLNKPLTKNDMLRIAEGIELDDGPIAADAIAYVEGEESKKVIGIELHSGRNRIVRRIFEHLGYRVSKLDRVYFAGLTKKNVRRGDWRFLTEREVSMLQMGAFE